MVRYDEVTRNISMRHQETIKGIRKRTSAISYIHKWPEEGHIASETEAMTVELQHKLGDLVLYGEPVLGKNMLAMHQCLDAYTLSLCSYPATCSATRGILLEHVCAIIALHAAMRVLGIPQGERNPWVSLYTGALPLQRGPFQI